MIVVIILFSRPLGIQHNLSHRLTESNQLHPIDPRHSLLAPARTCSTRSTYHQYLPVINIDPLYVQQFNLKQPARTSLMLLECEWQTNRIRGSRGSRHFQEAASSNRASCKSRLLSWDASVRRSRKTPPNSAISHRVPNVVEETKAGADETDE